MVDPQLLLFGGLILVVILFMFRNGRKRQRDQLALTQGLKPGAEVMTSFGVFGTIESIDDAENRVVLKTSPTSQITIHRQAIGKIVTPVVDDGAELNGEPVVLDDAASDPQFGQRLDAEQSLPETETGTTETPVRRTGGGGTGSKAE